MPLSSIVRAFWITKVEFGDRRLRHHGERRKERHRPCVRSKRDDISDAAAFRSEIRTTLLWAGLIALGIGLIGEYVGRTYEQVRGRPRYLIAAVLAPGEEPDTQRLRALETTRV